MIDMYGNYGAKQQNDRMLAKMYAEVCETIAVNMTNNSLIEKEDAPDVGLGASALLMETVGEDLITEIYGNRTLVKLAFVYAATFEQLHPGELARIGRLLAEDARRREDEE